MIRKKGFTLIELIIVIAIIGIIVTLGIGVYKGYTKEANLSKHLTYVKELETASERYYMSKGDWPRLTDEPMTRDDLITYAERIKDITGEEVELDPEGKYYEINYKELSSYTKVPTDKSNYILQNPVGQVYYLENITELGKSQLGSGTVEDPNDDIQKSPGNNELVAGDMQEGYFGIVQASELITGDALASELGITAGVSQFSEEGWLKFAYNGNTQYIAKKPIRSGISWNSINAIGAVFGTKTIVIDGLTYKVRLMKGLNDGAIGYNGVSNHRSEWNKLMLPIHVQAKNKSWGYSGNVEADADYWGIDFTDQDLHSASGYGNGTNSWCQETYLGAIVTRGYLGVSYSTNSSPGYTHPIGGWRPVLELVH